MSIAVQSSRNVSEFKFDRVLEYFAIGYTKPVIPRSVNATHKCDFLGES